MAIRFCLLISLLGLVWLAFAFKGPEPWGENLCLACHRQHYETNAGCTHCHRGDSRTNRPEIAHRNLIPAEMAGFAVKNDRRTQDGLRLLDRLACRRCHCLDGQGAGTASDLGRAYSVSRVEDLVFALRHPVEQMPDFALDSGQVAAVVSALLRMSLQKATLPVPGPVMVHFSTVAAGQKHPFDLSCGGCHRALSHKFGALGHGDVAPNLSGLLGQYYPEFGNGLCWTEERLVKWLSNPRQLRKNALMPPVLLNQEDLVRILEVFGDSLDTGEP